MSSRSGAAPEGGGVPAGGDRQPDVVVGTTLRLERGRARSIFVALLLSYETRRRLRSFDSRLEAVGAVLETYHNFEHLRALTALSCAIGARPSRVQAYYDTADIATKQKFAAIALKAAYSCDFQVAQIEASRIETAVRPLLTEEAPYLAGHESGTDRTIDLSFLGPLKVSREDVLSEAACDRTTAAEGSLTSDPSIDLNVSRANSTVSEAATDLSTEYLISHADGETFLVADALYVRDCMREVFGLFHADVARDPRPMPSVTSSAVLVGSPGVGKSILFFLAALDQARKSKIVY